MMVAMGGGSNLEEGNRAEKETSMGQLESTDPASEIES